MDVADFYKCASCKKEIATDITRCVGCRSYFHPGCFKPHKTIGPQGERYACASKPEAYKRAGNTRAPTEAPMLPSSLSVVPTQTSSTTTAPPAITTTATTSASTVASSVAPDVTLANVLAAVQACATTVQTFRDEQLLHNAATDGRIVALQQDLAVHMDRLSADLKVVSERVRGVESRVTSLSATVSTNSAKHDALASSLTSRIDEVAGQQKSYAEALLETRKVTEETAEKVRALSSQVRQLQADRRSSEIVISGLPEKQGEDLRGLLRSAAACLGAPLAESAITRITRMRGTPEVNRPRLIHAVLSSRATRDAVIAGKRAKGRLLASELAADLEARPVHINDYLPRDTWSLLRKVRAEARARGYLHVWHRDGRILVKKAKDTAPIIIGEQAEIAAKLQ